MHPSHNFQNHHILGFVLKAEVLSNKSSISSISGFSKEFFGFFRYEMLKQIQCRSYHPFSKEEN